MEQNDDSSELPEITSFIGTDYEVTSEESDEVPSDDEVEESLISDEHKWVPKAIKNDGGDFDYGDEDDALEEEEQESDMDEFGEDEMEDIDEGLLEELKLMEEEQN